MPEDLKLKRRKEALLKRGDPASLIEAQEINTTLEATHSRLFHFTAPGGKARIIANVD